MNHIERFRAVMHFQPADRLPCIEFAVWWDKTVERWHSEGLPQALSEENAIRAFFGLDGYRQLWISPFTSGAPQAKRFGGPLIRSVREYDAFKEHLYPDPPFDVEKVRSWKKYHEKGETVFWITLEGYFWFPRSLLGIEGHLLAFHENPELLHRINSDLVRFHLRAIDLISRVCPPDFMTFAEDMSYNKGPMIGKKAFDTFLLPYYRRSVPNLKELGILPLVDSDGDITMLIPWLEEAGIEGLLPLERMAGVDIVLLRKKYPGLKMIGGFDKTAMHSETSMRREFERILPVMRSGGYIPSVDHQTPPSVSLGMYRLYVDLLREYCAKAAAP